eukprot:746911-Hanusia_phi.AAC.5
MGEFLRAEGNRVQLEYTMSVSCLHPSNTSSLSFIHDCEEESPKPPAIFSASSSGRDKFAGECVLALLCVFVSVPKFLLSAPTSCPLPPLPPPSSSSRQPQAP